MAAQPVNGLVKFITSLKEIPSEAERDYHVREELAKVRCCFGRSSLSGYEKKKCILKLVYIHMIGYDVDLGHLEAVHLMASTSFQEKVAGYMACEVLLVDIEELRSLVINTVQADIHDASEHVQAIALNFIANSLSVELHEHMFNDLVTMLTVNPFESSMLRKKLYMCIMQLFRVNPKPFRLQEWKPKMADLLCKETDLGCLMALTNLMLAFVRLQKDGWDHCVAIILEVLLRLHSGSMQGKGYYTLQYPWLVVKLLTFLASIEPNPKACFMNTLMHVLERLLGRVCFIKVPMTRYNSYITDTQEQKTVWTLRMSIAHETVRVIGTWFDVMPSFSVHHLSEFLDKLLTSKSSHVHVNALEMVASALKNSSLHRMLKSKVPHFVGMLGSADTTVRCRAAEIVSQLCDDDNWELIVPELLSVVRESDITTQDLIVPTLLGVIERVVPRGSLYVESVFKVVQFTHKPTDLSDVCRILQSTSRPQQIKVVTKCISVLSGTLLNDALLRICATMLEYYCHTIERRVLGELAALLKRYFLLGTPTTQCVILTAVAKFAAYDNSLWASTELFLESHAAHCDVNVQSTACELLHMMLMGRSLFQSMMLENYESDSCHVLEFASSDISSRCTADGRDEDHHMRSHGRTTRHRDPTSDNSPGYNDSDSSRDSLLEELVLSNSPGVIFSDGTLSVWVEQAYRHHDAKLLVRICNIRDGKEAVRITRLSLRSPPHLEGLCHNRATGVLAPGESVGHKLSFILRSFGVALPQYSIDYTLGPSVGQPMNHRVVLRLPVSLNKFLTPLPVDAHNIGNLWDSLKDKELSGDVIWGSDVHHLSDIVMRCVSGHIVKISNKEAIICCSCKSADEDPAICLASFRARPKGQKISVKVRGSSPAVASTLMHIVLTSTNKV